MKIEIFVPYKKSQNLIFETYLQSSFFSSNVLFLKRYYYESVFCVDGERVVKMYVYKVKD